MEKLALELFRSQWLLHTDSVQQYSALAADYLAGKSVSTGLFSSIPIPDVPSNVALITAAGVMTKADVCNSAGSLNLAQQVTKAANDRTIDAIIILSESGPGGQVDGTQILGDAIYKARSKKPVYGAISGMACSAHYWMISQCTKVFATSDTDQIGCIGVMATMRRNKESASASYEVIYSDLSPDKNLESRDNDVLKQQYLNPVATLFHDNVKRGRGDSLKLDKENVLSGKTYISGAAATNGLIDGVKSISQIISAALAESKKQKQPMSQTNSHLRFQNALKAARATAFQIGDSGFALNETQLQLIDESLEASATLSADLSAAKADVARLTAELTAATAKATTAEGSLTTAQSRIEELEALDGPQKKATKNGEDKHEDQGEDPMAKYRTKYDAEVPEDLY